MKVSFKLKRFAITLILTSLALTNVSCAQEAENKSTVPDSGATSRAQQPTAENLKPELVYLKVYSAEASSFDESPDWAPKPDPMSPVDGDMETRWSSGYKDGEWIYFDFGIPKTVSKVIIKWEEAYATRYEISVSDDAETWKTVAFVEDEKGGFDEIDIKPATARYIKLTGLSRLNPEWGISVWEFEPYGPKDKNSGDLPKEEVFKCDAEGARIGKKLASIKITPGDITPSPGPITKTEFQRGVNYTSWDVDELAQETSDCSLVYISELNVTHIALMAVYYQDDAASFLIYPDEKKTTSDDSLGHAINLMHALGMKVMLKPHVDLIDEDARSNIIPSDEWFKNYKAFILHYAKLASRYNVELFCVGTELSNTTTEKWKTKWLEIIDEVRKVYKGPLVYAANWDEYDTVSFWPEMDYIGMDAYFPLTKKNNPPLTELIEAWAKHADIIEKWLKDNKLDQPVIFTEIGYDTIEGSNKQPYRILPTLAEYSESQEEQANCLEGLLAVMTKRPWFKGFYWWNYFPRPDIGPLGYTLRGKKGEKVLAEWYSKLK